MRRLVQLPLYAVLVVTIVALAGPFLSIKASIEIANNNQARALAAAQAAQLQQAESARQESCVLFSKLLDTYEETPPTTPAGRNVEAAYRDYYNGRLHCVPPRPKEK